MIGRVEAMLLLFSAATLSLAALRWNRGVPGVEQFPASIDRVADPPGDYDEDSIDIAFEQLVDSDPFRVSRAPSDIRYSPDALTTPQPTAPPFAPALVLRGIVGGPPWQAVIDGIPGAPPGTVARSGSVFDKLTIMSVTRDSVFVQTPDSAWYLTLIRGPQ